MTFPLKGFEVEFKQTFEGRKYLNLLSPDGFNLLGVSENLELTVRLVGSQLPLGYPHKRVSFLFSNNFKPRRGWWYLFSFKNHTFHLIEVLVEEEERRPSYPDEYRPVFVTFGKLLEPVVPMESFVSSNTADTRIGFQLGHFMTAWPHLNKGGLGEEVYVVPDGCLGLMARCAVEHSKDDVDELIRLST